MNSFFKKLPDEIGRGKAPTLWLNLISLKMTNRKHIFKDVSVIERFNTGSQTLDLSEALWISTIRLNKPVCCHGNHKILCHTLSLTCLNPEAPCSRHTAQNYSWETALMNYALWSKLFRIVIDFVILWLTNIGPN